MTLKKTFTVLFLLLAFISCGKSGSEKNSETQMESITDDSPVPRQALTFRVNPTMLNFSNEQQAKVLEASELIQRVVASDQFKKEILNYTVDGKKQFVDNDGLSNVQIYRKILEGSEKMLKHGRNNVMDLEMELYQDETTTIGYTFPNVVRIFMNAKYFERFDATQVSDNMMHEWLHKIGFDHAIKYTPSRDDSVPYAIGYIVKRLARQYQLTGL